MIRSMTGFGSASVIKNDYHIKVQIKSINNRYLDIKLKAPRNIIHLEQKIKNLVKKRIKRGTIEVLIEIDFLSDDNHSYIINESLLKAYISAVDQIDKMLSVDNKINVFDLIGYDSSILKITDKDLKDNEFFEKNLLKSIDMSVDQLLEMSGAEGYNIKIDIENKISNINENLNSILSFSANSVDKNIDKLKERVGSYLDLSDKLTEDKILNEIVFYSDKLSIEEEMTRINSHLKLMIEELNSDKCSGKKLDFIAQEMLRETNTIGSKSGMFEITNSVINIKEQIENIREQVQNIE